MINKKLSYNTVGEFLIEQMPEFVPNYKEHLSDNYGEILPHVLFGDFTRFVIEIYGKSKKNSKYKDIFERSLDFVESLFLSGDKKLDELAHVSFLENLQGDRYGEIKKSLRPLSLKHLKMIEE